MAGPRGVINEYPYQNPSSHCLSLVINNGQPELYSSLLGFKGPVFTPEFGNWLAQTIGVNVTNSPLFAGTQSPIGKDLSYPVIKKRRRETIVHGNVPIKPEVPISDIDAVEMIPLEIGDEEKVEAYYKSAFQAFQQTNCRQIAKAYIKIVEPRKQAKYPYSGRRGAQGEKGDPEKTKPDWWPEGVTHREPDHLKKPERINLLIHIFRKLAKSHGITADKLEEAGLDAQRQIKPREKLAILDEIYKVRRFEECYERGEADSDSVVYVLNRDARTEEELQAISEAEYNPGAPEEKREVEVQDTQHQTPQSSIVSCADKIPTREAEAWRIFAISPVSDEQQQQHFQSPLCTCEGCSSPALGIGDISQWPPMPEPVGRGYSQNYLFSPSEFQQVDTGYPQDLDPGYVCMYT